MNIKLGISGSRNGITIAQRHAAFEYISRRFNDYGIQELHHGCCVGADYVIHELAHWLQIPIILHPPTNSGMVAPMFLETHGWTSRTPRPYLERNQDIVHECTHMLILPAREQTMRGSGTWSTYRYAMKQNKHVWGYMPDGSTIISSGAGGAV